MFVSGRADDYSIMTNMTSVIIGNLNVEELPHKLKQCVSHESLSVPFILLVRPFRFNKGALNVWFVSIRASTCPDPHLSHLVLPFCIPHSCLNYSHLVVHSQTLPRSHKDCYLNLSLSVPLWAGRQHQGFCSV